MTPDRVVDILIGHMEEAVRKRRNEATSSMLAIEQYAHAVGHIEGLRKSIEVCKQFRREYLGERLPEKVIHR